MTSRDSNLANSGRQFLIGKSWLGPKKSSGRPWSALVGSGRSWSAPPPAGVPKLLVGPGRPWSALVGPGRPWSAQVLALGPEGEPAGGDLPPCRPQRAIRLTIGGLWQQWHRWCLLSYCTYAISHKAGHFFIWGETNSFGKIMGQKKMNWDYSRQMGRKFFKADS